MGEDVKTRKEKLAEIFAYTEEKKGLFVSKKTIFEIEEELAKLDEDDYNEKD